jgi:nitrite reductase (NADH) large subunit
MSAAPDLAAVAADADDLAAVIDRAELNAVPTPSDLAEGTPVADLRTAAPTRRPSLVVIGNGMAGIRTIEELFKLAPDRYDITVFGAEPHGNYNRILLSPLLSGEKQLDDIMLNPREWYARHHITLHAGDPVIAIDRARRRVRSAAGVNVHYDRLLIATGSKPVILPVPGHDLDGVIAFRDIQDVDTMLAGWKPPTV